MRKKYGHLTFIESFSSNWRTRWTCACDCGAVKSYDAYKVKIGETKSCGCLRAHSARKLHTTHGDSVGGYTTELRTWNHMHARCKNPKNKSYPRYGERGIKVCARWSKYENFLKDMGRKPTSKHTLDRIDNSKGYSKKNCRWATPKEQANNTRRNVMITINGETKNLTQWCEIKGVPAKAVFNRIGKLGWSAEEALAIPVGKPGGSPTRYKKFREDWLESLE